MTSTEFVMTPFVWSLIGADAGEPLSHIIIRKEEERKAGAGEFWWGLGTPLGAAVESAAILNSGTLPTLFSALEEREGDSNQGIRVWSGWRSIKGGAHGSIPNHVLVTSGYDADKPDKPHYALVCHSDIQIALGDHGFFDPTSCRTLKNGKAPGPSQRAALLTRQGAHPQGRYTVAFQAGLVGPWYVKLTRDRVLTGAELMRLRQYQDGDNWLHLVNSLRGKQSEAVSDERASSRN
jgi:hypothetical protein